MGGQVSLPVLQALHNNQIILLVSQHLLTELREVTQRPRLKKSIDDHDVQELLELLELRGEFIVVKTTPPRCRDPKDEPVLATAIDGQDDAIVTGDDDLRADDDLRRRDVGVRCATVGSSLTDRSAGQAGIVWSVVMNTIAPAGTRGNFCGGLNPSYAARSLTHSLTIARVKHVAPPSAFNDNSSPR